MQLRKKDGKNNMHVSEMNNNNNNNNNSKSPTTKNSPEETSASPTATTSTTADDRFYPNTNFMSWSEFFSLPPKTPNAPRGTYVGLYERLEMILAIIVVICCAISFAAPTYEMSHRLRPIYNTEDVNKHDSAHLISDAQLHPHFMYLQPGKLPTVVAGVLKFLTPAAFTHDEHKAGQYDLADHQWRNFDTNLWMLVPGMLAYVCMSQIVRRVCSSSSLLNFSPQRTAKVRMIVLAILNCVVVIFLHGWGAGLLLPILAIHFAFTIFAGPRLPRWLFLAIMWISLTALLITLEWRGGLETWFKQHFPWIVSLLPEKSIMRWNVVFNMQMLRLVAFSVDFLEARDKGESKAREVEKKHTTACYVCGQIALKNNANNKLIASEIQTLCYKGRTEMPRPLDDYYSFANFLAYILYMPLYIGGPISSFNGFVSHIYTPTKVMSVRELVRYAFRVFFLYYSLVVMMHLVYVSSIRDSTLLVAQLPAFAQSGLTFLSLAFLWMKFSVIWKGFRLIGLLDGVEAPEDMLRCFCNTVRVAEFWRDWHASFNLWIVRYMYIPLGGNKNKMLVVFPIFFFIAIWHDSKLELLGWALIMCVNLVLELALTNFCSKLGYWKRSGMYRYWVTLGGVYTITMLTIANALGFGTGMSTGQGFLEKYVTQENAKVASVWFSFLFCTCTISLMEREMEKNRIKKWSDELKVAVGE